MRAVAALGAACVLLGCESGDRSLFEPPPPAPTPLPDFGLCINEFMPDNDGAVPTSSGDELDWVELHNPTAEPVSLDGWSLTDDLEDLERHRFEGLTMEPGAFVLLWADASPQPAAGHLGFALSADGGELALFDPHGRGSILRYGPVEGDRAIARRSDCCSEPDCIETVAGGTPGVSNEVEQPWDLVVVERGSDWRYHGGAAPEPDWTSGDFDDSGWELGEAPLGYGNSGLETRISPASTRTAWFRADFQHSASAAPSLAFLRLRRDAGAVVYLNGVEVARSNLPQTVVEPGTPALRGVSGQEEEIYFPFEADADLLRDGANQLAVEVHESAGAEELGFDLELGLRRGPLEAR